MGWCWDRGKRMQSPATSRPFLCSWTCWRLLWMPYRGRVDPSLPCTTVFAEHEWQAMYEFVHKSPVVPEQPPSKRRHCWWPIWAVSWRANPTDNLASKSCGVAGAVCMTYPKPAMIQFLVGAALAHNDKSPPAGGIWSSPLFRSGMTGNQERVGPFGPTLS